jgi:hypothetical protein
MALIQYKSAKTSLNDSASRFITDGRTYVENLLVTFHRSEVASR